MSNIAEVQDIKSSEVEIIFPSAELSQTSASSGDIAGPALRRHSSMPNIAVQTSSAGDADHNLEESDVGLPFVALTQKPVTIDPQPANDSAQTVLVKPSVSSTSLSLQSVSKPSDSSLSVSPPLVSSASITSPSVSSSLVSSASVTSPFVYSPPDFSPSVSSPLVSSASVTSPSVFSPSDFSPSVSSPLVSSESVTSPSDSSTSVSSASVSSPQKSSRDFEDPQRAVIKHVPSRDLIKSSDLENLCTTAQVQTAVNAANLAQDPSEVRRCDATEPLTETAAKAKRRSIWKRTKRFVRRLFCCA